MTHTIYACDNSFLRKLPDQSVHLVVTSPPYVTTEFRRGQAFDYVGFLEHFETVCSQLFRLLVPGGRFALNVADIISKYRYTDDNTIGRVPLASDLFQVAQGLGFRLLERFIWDKGYTRNFGGPLLGSYPYPLTLFNNNYFEYILILKKPGKRHVKQGVRKASALTLQEWQEWTQQWWRVESISERVSFHRAVFPIEIPYRLIRMYSCVQDSVLDPYMGTGATMIAAHLAERSSVGFEIDSTVTSMVEQRIEMELKPLLHSRPSYEIRSEPA